MLDTLTKNVNNTDDAMDIDVDSAENNEGEASETSNTIVPDSTVQVNPRTPSVSLRLVHDNENYIMRLKVTINIIVYIMLTESTIAKSFRDLLILLLVH